MAGKSLMYNPSVSSDLAGDKFSPDHCLSVQFKTITGYSCAVKLTKIDLKNGAETVTLQPPTDSDSPIKIEKGTSLEARHWGAVSVVPNVILHKVRLLLPPALPPAGLRIASLRFDAPAWNGPTTSVQRLLGGPPS